MQLDVAQTSRLTRSFRPTRFKYRTLRDSSREEPGCRPFNPPGFCVCVNVAMPYGVVKGPHGNALRARCLVRGYYGVPTNIRALRNFCHNVKMIGYRALQHRSQRARWEWAPHKPGDPIGTRRACEIRKAAIGMRQQRQQRQRQQRQRQQPSTAAFRGCLAQAAVRS